jgi:beta-glucanase (GH16 family)
MARLCILKRIVPGTRLLTASAFLFCLFTNAFCGAWELFWSDEFDSAGVLSPKNWWIRVKNAGWVNGEQQRYTDTHDQAASNIFVADGNLIIVAKKTNNEITSGRIESENLQNFMYGRMEARARLPISKGMWPAFWMEGWDINKGAGWPGAGEIDIMEGRGRLPSWTSGAFHCSAGGLGGNYTLPAGAPNMHDAYHKFAIEWGADSIMWFCDTAKFMTMTKKQIPTAPINKNYFFLVNLAVGGNFDGNSDATTIFPESLIVDYVRVYHWNQDMNSSDVPLHGGASSAYVKKNGESCIVHLPFEQDFFVELIRVDGKTVFSQRGSGLSYRFGTGVLAPGVYCINVRGAFGSIQRKLCIRH